MIECTSLFLAQDGVLTIEEQKAKNSFHISKSTTNMQKWEKGEKNRKEKEGRQKEVGKREEKRR